MVIYYVLAEMCGNKQFFWFFVRPHLQVTFGLKFAAPFKKEKEKEKKTTLYRSNPTQCVYKVFGRS